MHTNTAMDLGGGQDAPKTTHVRKSRAERARLEIERRHRSSSRGSDNSNRPSTASSNAGAPSANRVAAISNATVNSGVSNRNSASRLSSRSVQSSQSSRTSSTTNSSPMRSRYEKYEKMGVRLNKNKDTNQQHMNSQHSNMSQASTTSNSYHDQQIAMVAAKSQTQQDDNEAMRRKLNVPEHKMQQLPKETMPLPIEAKQSVIQEVVTREQQQTQYQHQVKQQIPQQQQTQYQQHQQQVKQQIPQQQPRAAVSTTRNVTPVIDTASTMNKPVNVNKSPTNISPTNAEFHQPNASVLMNQANLESPLSPIVQRALGDRSYEKRKNAALEVEALVKSLAETASTANPANSREHRTIAALIQLLGRDFCPSMNINFRKGGLIGLAAVGIGLLNYEGLKRVYLEHLIRPVLMGFDDPEPRVRYYACESMYNIAKVARESILPYFNMIFEGVASVLADTDDDVREGANLLDRIVKDIVTETESFSVVKFLPLLQNYIRRSNPYHRKLVVGWIIVLDGIPDVCLIDHLPDFLDGLFNMLGDQSLEIREAADSALSNFLKEIRESVVLEFGPIVSILVFQCESKEKLNRLTAISWIWELIHHPNSGGDKLLPFLADVLKAILNNISDGEGDIRKISERSNNDLLFLVRDTKHDFRLDILIDALVTKLSTKDDVPTKVAVLKWINMLLEKRRRDMDTYIQGLMNVLMKLLSDKSDVVVLLTVQVLSRICLSDVFNKGILSKDKLRDEEQFGMVIKQILTLFKQDRRLLESRGSLIVRRFCALLNAKSVYLIMADIISEYDVSDDSFTLEFVATMVQTLNLILLTAPELNNLRKLLESSFAVDSSNDDSSSSTILSRRSPMRPIDRYHAKNEGARVFASLFHCWSNNPVSTFSLCLLAQAYDLAFSLVKKFSELEVTVGFLMQIDKLIHMIESPIFVHVRLQLLDVEAPYHTFLLKSMYGLLMLLPQSDAYHSLNDRLTAVCNLRDNLGIRPNITASPSGVVRNEDSSVHKAGLEALDLLARFDEVTVMHKKARTAIQQQGMLHHAPTKERTNINGGNNGVHQTQRQMPLASTGRVKVVRPSTQ